MKIKPGDILTLLILVLGIILIIRIFRYNIVMPSK